MITNPHCNDNQMVKSPSGPGYALTSSHFPACVNILVNVQKDEQCAKNMFYDSHLNKSVSQLDQVLKSVHLKNIAVNRLVLETFLSNIRLDKESEQCSLWAMSIPGKNYNFTLIQNQVLKSVINIACGDSDHFNSSDRPIIPWWTEALERCCLSPQRPSNAPCRNFKGRF